MKNETLCHLICPFAAITLAGCASPPAPPIKEALLPEIEILQVKENSDEALKLSRESKLDIETINTKLIEMDKRLLVIEEGQAVLSAAKMEELENKITLLSEEMRLLENGSKILSKGGNRVKSNKPMTIKNTFTPHPKPGRDKPEIAETEAQTYKLASDHFYARRYTKAIGIYDNIITKYPKGIYADNAMYWKGECHFAMGNYAKAIASYQRIFSIPNSEKSDDAQFKIGLSYLRTGEKRQAVKEFKKLLSLYPDSEYVGRARQELKKL